MSIENTELKTRLDHVLNELIRDYSEEYVLLALKQISDQQLTFISFSHFRLLNEPILKLYENIVREIETVIFDGSYGIESPEDISNVIRWSLQKFSQFSSTNTPSDC